MRSLISNVILETIVKVKIETFGLCLWASLVFSQGKTKDIHFEI